MDREQFVKTYGSHWRVEGDFEDLYWAKEHPGPLDTIDATDRVDGIPMKTETAEEAVQSALRCMQKKAARDLERAEAWYRKLRKPSWLLFVGYIQHGKSEVESARERSSKALLKAQDRVREVSRETFVGTIRKEYLPDTIPVHLPVTLGDEIWVVQADWVMEQGIKLRRHRVTGINFYLMDPVWSVSYTATPDDGGRELGFSLKDIHAEQGFVEIRIAGWSGHLSLENAEKAIGIHVENLRQAALAAEKLIRAPETNALPSC